MGKSTNYIWPMVIFNSYVTNYQRVVMLRFYACDQPSVEAGVESPATCWTCNQQLPLHVDSLPRHFEFWSVRTLAGSCARTLCYAMLCYDYEIFSRACAPTWSKPHLTHSSDFALVFFIEHHHELSQAAEHLGPIIARLTICHYFEIDLLILTWPFLVSRQTSQVFSKRDIAPYWESSLGMDDFLTPQGLGQSPCFNHSTCMCK